VFDKRSAVRQNALTGHSIWPWIDRDVPPSHSLMTALRKPSSDGRLQGANELPRRYNEAVIEAEVRRLARAMHGIELEYKRDDGSTRPRQAASGIGGGGTRSSGASN